MDTGLREVDSGINPDSVKALVSPIALKHLRCWGGCYYGLSRAEQAWILDHTASDWCRSYTCKEIWTSCLPATHTSNPYQRPMQRWHLMQCQRYDDILKRHMHMVHAVRHGINNTGRCNSLMLQRWKRPPAEVWRKKAPNRAQSLTRVDTKPRIGPRMHGE